MRLSRIFGEVSCSLQLQDLHESSRGRWAGCRSTGAGRAYLWYLIWGRVISIPPARHSALLDRERLTDATMLIVYSLTALFGIIGISSAAVAILNSLYQRRKEFAMLRSVGLDRKGLDRLLHIEGFFLGGKPLVIGLPILFLIAAVLMWMQDVTFMEFIQVFPLLGLAAYIVLVLMVISGIYRAASRRIRRDIIVEVLKDENV